MLALNFLKSITHIVAKFLILLCLLHTIVKYNFVRASYTTEIPIYI